MRSAAKKSEQGPISIQTLWYTHTHTHTHTHTKETKCLG